MRQRRRSHCLGPGNNGAIAFHVSIRMVVLRTSRGYWGAGTLIRFHPRSDMDGR